MNFTKILFLFLLLNNAIANVCGDPEDSNNSITTYSSTRLLEVPSPDPYVFYRNNSGGTSSRYYVMSTADINSLQIHENRYLDHFCENSGSNRETTQLVIRMKTKLQLQSSQNINFPSNIHNDESNWQLWSPAIVEMSANNFYLVGTIHFGNHNTAIGLFTPTNSTQGWTANSPINDWTLDRILVGGGAQGKSKFSAYDYKVYKDGNKKYAIYNYNENKGNPISHSTNPPMQSIYIQEIDDNFVFIASSTEKRIDPDPLETAWGFKLIEGGKIHKLSSGNYAFFYSTGTYKHENYRIGMATSTNGILGDYKKMRNSDGTVRFVLQSKYHDKPGYVRNMYKSPGIPNIVNYGSGNDYKLIFHANEYDQESATANCPSENWPCLNPEERYAHQLKIKEIKEQTFPKDNEVIFDWPTITINFPEITTSSAKRGIRVYFHKAVYDESGTTPTTYLNLPGCILIDQENTSSINFDGLCNNQFTNIGRFDVNNIRAISSCYSANGSWNDNVCSGEISVDNGIVNIP